MSHPSDARESRIGCAGDDDKLNYLTCQVQCRQNSPQRAFLLCSTSLFHTGSTDVDVSSIYDVKKVGNLQNQLQRSNFDDYYEDEYGFSPASASPGASQYLYDRSKDNPTLDTFLQEDGEEDAEFISAYLDQLYDELGEEGEYFEVEDVKQALRVNNYNVNNAINFLYDKQNSANRATDEQFDMEIETKGKKGEQEAKKVTLQDPKREEKTNSTPKKPAIITLGASSTTIPVEDKMENLNLSEERPKTILDAIKREEVGSNASSTTSSTTSSPASKQHKQMSANRRKEIEKMISGSSKKEHLNLVVIGHVDAGKSTIMGHLLYLNGVVNQKTMHKYEKESKNIGKSSFSFAWVLDESEEERITLLDAPGHRDFVPNMISGAAQADVGILVVDAAPDAFEKGFEADGQTKEHALLARSLGISQLAVVVNKLDMAEWSQSRYDDIVGKMSLFLKASGFRDKSFSFLPLSGLAGENIVQRKSDVLNAWYNGPTLMEKIDSFDPAVRDINKPFRLCISDLYRAQVGGLTVAGRIEAGVVSKDDKLLISPLNEVCTVSRVRIHGEAVEYATAGDYVDISISGVDAQLVSSGNVLSDPEKPIGTTNRFKAQILTFVPQRPILNGQMAEMHYSSLNEAIVITKLIALLDKTTGEVKKKNPRVLGDHATAVVEIQLSKSVQKKICVELYSEYKQLGRFTLRENGKTFAAGIITEIL
ncbi:hypothetical protein PROFUN_09747 [Planoprotostelium fungivorum]|uniref:Tr-type G domain-containing protein n=1 Tax=Planoprotostelium fungivorum TaxID=1890364 RepID=A0A2P6NF92_9EUKA|nr:hypothetical protein PROFUN_09747 [Planoprotostelium fungivorum]